MIDAQEQIAMVKAEQLIDLYSGEYKFTDPQRKHTPFFNETEAWEAILKLRQYRHNNHMLYCLYEVKKESGYYWIFERREII